LSLELLSWIFAIGVALAAGGVMALLASGLLEGVVSAAYAHGSFRQLARRALGGPRLSLTSAFDLRRLSWKALLPLPVGLALAVRCREAPLMAIYFLAVGVVVTLFLLVSSQRSTMEGLEELVEKLTSIWVIRPQPFLALDEAARGIGGRLERLVKRAVNAYRLGVPTEHIWAEMRQATRDPHLRQLTDILAWAEQSGAEETGQVLEDLRRRVEARRNLKRRTRVSLALTSGTTRFFQAANAAVVVLVPLVPFLRQFYSQSLGRQVLFVVIATWPLLGALYMDRELRRLRDLIC